VSLLKGGLMKKILVVDDEKGLRETVVVALQDRGFETIEADNGAAALDLARAHRPDLIITDVMMDNGNGFLLRELLLEDPKTASIPMILMSGAAQKAGAWESDTDIEYLAKPFSNAQILSAVERKLKH